MNRFTNILVYNVGRKRTNFCESDCFVEPVFNSLPNPQNLDHITATNVISSMQSNKV